MYSFVRSLLFRLNAERAHHVTLRWLSWFPSTAGWLRQTYRPSHRVEQHVLGLHFEHPVGLAAGLDKNGIAVDGFLAAGFSFIEVGTVTPRPQPGNPQPRLFRLREDEALINRMGFNNHGARALQRHLMRRQRKGIIGINLGKNKLTPNEQAIGDYLTLIDAVFALADYLIINVSSPNTPGLRDLQESAQLLPLVKAVCTRRDELSLAAETKASPHRPAVLVKLAPDLSNEAILALAEELPATGMDGFIATNTTLARRGLTSNNQREAGGLSGRPLFERSTEVVSLLYRATDGQIPIIGSGGIFSVDDAYRKIRAGACLLELYTGFIYKGPALISEIVQGLDARLAQDGFSNIQEAIGVDARND